MQIGSIARWVRRDKSAWTSSLFVPAIAGRGRDVILLHGLSASRACWDGAASALGSGIRLHTPQIRGFAGAPAKGENPKGHFLQEAADALAEYIRRECTQPAAVVGHSMGGLVTLILARDHPDVVDRAMVVDVPSFFSVLINPFATAAMFSGFAEATRRRHLQKDAADIEDELRRTVARLVVDPAQVERIVQWGIMSDQQLTADVMAEVMTTDLRPHLPQIGPPVDVIYAWDKAAPTTRVGIDQVYTSAYNGLRDCRRLRIDDARHYVMLDQPGIFYQAVRDWLAR